MTYTLTTIARYPVKGLSADFLASVTLSPDEGIPGDRRYALADGAEAANLLQPRWLPRDQFLTLLRCPRLAALQTLWEEDSNTLTILRDHRQVARAALSTAIGRACLSDFFAAFLKGSLRAPPLVMESPSIMFSDCEDALLSVLFTSSLADLERIVGSSVDARRFRCNLIIDGPAPWEEFGWIGGVLRIGPVRLHILGRIPRTAECSVNPDCGIVDINMPQCLKKGLGHSDFGIYARVIRGGTISSGDIAAFERF